MAEDNAVNQQVILLLLRKLGHSGHPVGNGREAVAALEMIPYDLVLMDCRMPEMDGYAATAEIRRREGPGRHVPIIAVTANAAQDEGKRCRAAGMDDYLAKPITLEALHAMLGRWLPQRIAPVSLARVSREPALEREKPAAEIGRLRHLVGSDQQQLRALIDVFLAQTEERMSTLRAALAGGDMAEVADYAHALRGASGTFGAVSMMDASAKLERLAVGGATEGVAEAACELEVAVRRVVSFLSDPEWDLR